MSLHPTWWGHFKRSRFSDRRVVSAFFTRVIVTNGTIARAPFVWRASQRQTITRRTLQRYTYNTRGDFLFFVHETFILPVDFHVYFRFACMARTILHSVSVKTSDPFTFCVDNTTGFLKFFKRLLPSAEIRLENEKCRSLRVKSSEVVQPPLVSSSFE